jgi:hypothetical protein
LTSAHTVSDPVRPELLEFDPEVWLLAYGSPYTRDWPVPAIEEMAGVQTSVHAVPLPLVNVTFTSVGVTVDPPRVVVR